MFRFRLETILRYRGQIEESEKRELGKIRFQLSAAENEKVRSMEAVHESGMALDEKKAAGSFTPEDFFLHYEFVEGTKRKVEKQNRIIKKIEEKAKVQRGKVVEAMRKRQVLSTLKSHKYQDYLMDENRAEQNFLDEVVSTRWKGKDR